MNQNDTDVANALAVIAGDTPTQTFGNITGATTITGDGGLNVIQVNGSINLNNFNLTLTGTSSDYFLVRVTGGMSLVGTAALTLGGAVTSDHVIYDFTGGSTYSIKTNIGDSVNGILISQNEAMTLDGTFNGGLIGGNDITLMSGAIVNQATNTAVPESGSFAVVIAIPLVLGFSVRRSKNKRIVRA